MVQHLLVNGQTSHRTSPVTSVSLPRALAVVNTLLTFKPNEELDFVRVINAFLLTKKRKKNTEA